MIELGCALCDKCDKPLSTRFWLHLFYEDGREEKIFNGTPPTRGRYVAVYVDVKCRKGWEGKISQDRQAELREAGMPGFMRKDSVPEVEFGGRTWTLDDMAIRTEGARFLMVMPKTVAIA